MPADAAASEAPGHPAIAVDGLSRDFRGFTAVDGISFSVAPGEIFGLAQSGRREGGVVDLKRDGLLVERARDAAARLLAGDPLLEDPANSELRRFLRKKYKEEFDLAALS